MSTHAITDAENSLVKAEPVIAYHAGAAVLGYAGTLLVTHGVITHDQASALTQQVLPAVVAGLLVVLGVIVRRIVSPAAVFAQRVEEEVQKRLEAAAGIAGPTAPFAAALSTVAGAGINKAAASQVASVPADAEPIHVDPADFLPADTEVPAAAEPAPDGALPADPAGAHAADNSDALPTA